jgi:hypothetical protein
MTNLLDGHKVNIFLWSTQKRGICQTEALYVAMHMKLKKTQGAQTKVLNVIMYVDDLIFIGNSQSLIDEFKNVIKSEFELIDFG